MMLLGVKHKYVVLILNNPGISELLFGLFEISNWTVRYSMINNLDKTEFPFCLLYLSFHWLGYALFLIRDGDSQFWFFPICLKQWIYIWTFQMIWQSYYQLCVYISGQIHHQIVLDPCFFLFALLFLNLWWLF